ncbi:MAG: hypothetical protein JNL08_15100 [Planctomycetes bacterium]|nr:hypothetical protein [Planctomycetota bacterium]
MPSLPRAPNPIVPWLQAAVVGAAVLWASDLLVPPAAVPLPGHGERFAAMTTAPLALAGEFPQRILWPLLAWACGLGGERAPVFAQVVNGALLAVVFWFARQRSAAWQDALLVTAAVAVTGTVLVYKPMACLSDPLVFLLLLLAVHHVRRPAWFWGLVLAAAFAHEMTFLLAPWLVWLRRCAGSSWRREAAWLGGTAALFAGWLAFVRACGTGASYGIAYYLASNFWVPWGLPAVWLLLLLEVLVEFGPLLAVVVWALRAGRLEAGRVGFGLLAGCIALLPLVAYDVMRFAVFLFLPLVGAALALLQAPRGRLVLGALTVAAAVCYRWTHPFADEAGGRAFRHLSGQVLGRFISDRQADVQPLSTPASGAGYLRDLVADNTGIWLGAAGAAVVVVAFGLWLARSGAPGRGQPRGERTTQNASP